MARPSSRGRTAGPRSCCLDEALAGLVQYGGRQRHVASRNGGVTGNRRIAMAVQDPQHLALGLGAEPRGSILDLRQTFARRQNPSRCIRPRRCPGRPTAAFRGRTNHGRCATPCRCASRPERAMTSASAGPTSPPRAAAACRRDRVLQFACRRRRDSGSRSLPETAGADRQRAAPRWCRS